MPAYTHQSLEQAFGVQPRQEGIWYRPLILGDNLFTCVAHVPPNGGLTIDSETAQQEQIELSLYLLNGHLKASMQDKSVMLVRHTAIHVPAGAGCALANQGETPASVYVACTPSPFGPGAPIEHRQGVRDMAELRSWSESQGHGIWSSEEMAAMAGTLAERPENLGELDAVFKNNQTGDMNESAPPWIALWDAEGYRHGHDPHPPDDFWFRPVVSGLKHLTYIGQIPPNGGVPPSPGEAAHVEMVIYSLAGQLGCIFSDMEGNEKERFVIPPHHAVYAPLNVPLGFWNAGDVTASFALSFTPTRPDRATIPGFRTWATSVREWAVVPVDFLNAMLGKSLWS